MKIFIKVKPRLMKETVDRARLERLAQMGDKAAQADLEREKERSGEGVRYEFEIREMVYSDGEQIASELVEEMSLGFDEAINWIKNNRKFVWDDIIAPQSYTPNRINRIVLTSKAKREKIDDETFDEISFRIKITKKNSKVSLNFSEEEIGEFFSAKFDNDDTQDPPKDYLGNPLSKKVRW